MLAARKKSAAPLQTVTETDANVSLPQQKNKGGKKQVAKLVAHPKVCPHTHVLPTISFLMLLAVSAQGITLEVGTVVKSKFCANKPAPLGCASYKNHYYTGKISEVNEGDTTTYTILYDDGAKEINVCPAAIKIYQQ